MKFVSAADMLTRIHWGAGVLGSGGRWLVAIVVYGVAGASLATGVSAAAASGQRGPLSPVQLENRTEQFVSTRAPQPTNFFSVSLDVGGGSYRYRGNANGDVASWILEPHGQVMTGPCSKGPGYPGNTASLFSKTLAGMREHRCSSATNNGYPESSGQSLKAYCTVYLGGTRPYKACLTVPMQPVLNYAGTLAAESVGVALGRFGSASRVVVTLTAAAEKAVIRYRHGTAARTLRELTIWLTSAGRVAHRELWY